MFLLKNSIILPPPAAFVQAAGGGGFLQAQEGAALCRHRRGRLFAGGRKQSFPFGPLSPPPRSVVQELRHPVSFFAGANPTFRKVYCLFLTKSLHYHW